MAFLLRATSGTSGDATFTDETTLPAYTAAYTYTEWFNLPIIPTVGTAGVPGTPDASAMSYLGAINVPVTCYINEVHLHQIKDGTGGSNVLELYRRRGGVMTLIATVSLASGGGDFQTVGFTFVSEALKFVEAGDYLFLQATSVMSAAGRAAGVVDVHFGPNP